MPRLLTIESQTDFSNAIQRSNTIKTDMKDLQLELINHFLVEMDETEEERVTESGLVIPGSDKPPNYGTVLLTPKIIYIKDSYNHEEFLKSIQPGDIVFFPLNVSLNYIEVEGLVGKKLVLVPVDIVQAVWRKEKSDE